MIKIGKGAAGKEFWQLGAGDRRHRHLRIPGRVDRKRVGCCARIRMYEENARFALLILIMFIYLCCGAALFHVIEHDHELTERRRYAERVMAFKAKYCSDVLEPGSLSSTGSNRQGTTKVGSRPGTYIGVDCDELDDLLDLRGNLSAAGLTSPRLKWDWSGSFYFVGTVVSTIGKFISFIIVKIMESIG